MKKLESNGFAQQYEFDAGVKVPGTQSLFVDVRIADKTSPRFVSERQWAHANKSKFKERFRIRGGIMADEMGLGKTISMLALALSNPRKQSKEGLEVKHKGNVVFESKASLVVCAPHLVAQWAKEIKEKTMLSVLKISTLANIKKATYKSLMDADIVVAPYSLIVKSKNYVARYKEDLPSDAKPEDKFPMLHHIGWHRIIADEAHEIKKQDLIIWERFHSNYRWYVTGTPFPHEYESFVKAITFLGIELENTTSPHKRRESWFASGDSAQDNMAPFDVLMVKAIKKVAYWRNSKQDVQEQTDIPLLTENVEYIELSPIEQAMYDAASFVSGSEAKQREICSNPLGSKIIPAQIACHCKKLGSIPFQMLKYHRSVLIGVIRIYRINFKNRLATLEKDLKNEERKLIENKCKSQQEVVNDLKTDLRCLTKEMKSKAEEMINQACIAACYSRVLPRHHDDFCEICKEIAIDKCSSNCGHIFCGTCIIKHYVGNDSCPTCNSANVVAHLVFPPVSDEEQQVLKGAYTIDGVEALGQVHGSKMVAVAEYLYHVVQEKDHIRKVIVFSQYEKTLNALKESLLCIDSEAFGNQIITCKGNIHVRTKKIQAFNSLEPDAPRILMLSVLNAASGTQLEAASHVILLDPVVGTREEVQAIDAQAIARSHRLGQTNAVEAIRFIVQGSIEQTDYEKAYGRKSRLKSARKVIL